MADSSDLINTVRAFDSSLAEKLVEQGECIVYAGYRNRDGYGKLSRAGRVYFAHRYVYSGVYGHIPTGMRVLHKCDNPPCCNPNHLFIGTQQDNVADMVKKGRGFWPGSPGFKKNEGEKNSKAKLTAADVAWIRENYSSKYHSPNGTARLAKKFGVSRGAILSVVKGKTWRAV